MANERGKAIDNTFLSIDNAEERGFIHRDYIAHCLRWTHVAKYLAIGQRYKTDKILDIGCGKEMPLPKLMYSSRMIPVTGMYVGIDYNMFEIPEMFRTGKFPMQIFPGKIFPDHLHFSADEKYDTIVCFEVLEHVEPPQVLKMLEAMRDLITNEGTIFISTPNYDEGMGAAANHVNEMEVHALGALIEYAGLTNSRIYGTFASMREYKADLGLFAYTFERMREYYDSNYLATIFAPLFPMQSRNCLWELKKRKPSIPNHMDVKHPHSFEPIKYYSAPGYSSSKEWCTFIDSLEAK